MVIISDLLNRNLFCVDENDHAIYTGISQVMEILNLLGYFFFFMEEVLEIFFVYFSCCIPSESKDSKERRAIYHAVII